MPSDNESDSGSVTAEEEKKNPRTSWIYTLKKEELAEELTKFGLQTTGKVSSNRRLLSAFIRGEYRPSTAASSLEPSKEENQQLVSQKSSDNTSICNTVRKWNLNYDGDRDVFLFLERLGEMREAYKISDNDLILALPELLKGKALLWYRNNKSLWKTWAEFLTLFENQFLPCRYREKLDLEIRARTQGTNEKFNDYAIAIQTLMRRHGNYSEQQQFSQIYENMLPEYKLYGLRQNIKSLAELMKATLEYEAVKQAAQSFRPPINAAQAMFPDIAYKGQLPRPTNHSLPRQGQNAGRFNSYNAPRRVPQNNGQRNSGPRCWNCDKPGHRARDCRLPKKPASCRFCGAEGRYGDCTCSRAVNSRGDWKRRGLPSPQE